MPDPAHRRAVCSGSEPTAGLLQADWPGAKDNPVVFLNRRGQRLSVRGAHDIVTAIAAAAGLDDRPRQTRTRRRA